MLFRSGDYQIDEKLTESGEKLGQFNKDRKDKTMELFIDKQISCVRPFVDSIKTVNKLYNNSYELLFDKDNIYLEVVN